MAGKYSNSRMYSRAFREVDTNTRNYDLTIDFSEYSEVPIETEIIYINGDINTSKITATLVKRGEPMNLSGKRIVANIREGTFTNVTTVSGEVTDLALGQVTFSLPTSLVDERGINVFSIGVLSDNTTLLSQPYSYRIINSIKEGTLGSVTEKSILQGLIDEVETSKNEYRDMFEEMKDETAVMPQDIDDIIDMIGGL